MKFFFNPFRHFKTRPIAKMKWWELWITIFNVFMGACTRFKRREDEATIGILNYLTIVTLLTSLLLLNRWTRGAELDAIAGTGIMIVPVIIFGILFAIFPIPVTLTFLLIFAGAIVFIWLPEITSFAQMIVSAVISTVLTPFVCLYCYLSDKLFTKPAETHEIATSDSHTPAAMQEAANKTLALQHENQQKVEQVTQETASNQNSTNGLTRSDPAVPHDVNKSVLAPREYTLDVVYV